MQNTKKKNNQSPFLFEVAITDFKMPVHVISAPSCITNVNVMKEMTFEIQKYRESTLIDGCMTYPLMSSLN